MNDILKAAMNGARLPNWFWIALMLLGLGFQAGIVWMGQESAVHHLQEAWATTAREDSIRTARVETQLLDLVEQENRRNREMNFELEKITHRLGMIVRSIE